MSIERSSDGGIREAELRIDLERWSRGMSQTDLTVLTSFAMGESNSRTENHIMKALRRIRYNIAERREGVQKNRIEKLGDTSRPD